MKFKIVLTNTELTILELILIEARDASNDIHPIAIEELLERLKTARPVKRRKK